MDPSFHEQRMQQVLELFGEKMAQNIKIVDGMTLNCWEWTGRRTEDGYGKVYSRQEKEDVFIHRLAYKLFKKEKIPESLVIDHCCDNTLCCNPLHLRAVTQQENLRGSSNSAPYINSTKKHCPKRHPYDFQNTYVTKEGHRKCRTCARERQRLARLKKRGQTQ